MGIATLIPTAATPAERIPSPFDRDQQAGFIKVAIGLLDLADGDPDREEDDLAEQDDEPERDDHAEQDDDAGCCAGDDNLRDWAGRKRSLGRAPAHENEDSEPDDGPYDTTSFLNANDHLRAR